MALAIIAAAYLGYGLVSHRLRSTVITAPMVFTGLGLLIGPLGLSLVSTGTDLGLATFVFELTLVLVLFSDAYAIDAGRLVRERTLPLRLLAVGLPLTIGVGWAFAAVMFAGLDVWEAALVGAVLAPTDASLAQTVIVDRRVPRPIRDGLNVESGLNDGIALPFVLIFLGFATEAAGDGGRSVAEIFVRALVVSALIGGLVGWISGRLIVGARQRGWAAATWYPLVLLAAALFAYATAGLVDGSGFIAAWVAGLTAGMAVRRRTRLVGADDRLVPAAEDRAEPTFLDGLGALLTTASYLVFGALLLGPELAGFTAPVLVFAVLALTVVRMVPVVLSLVRTHLGRPTIAFVGWFGPRGLASIVFTFLIIEEELPNVPLIATIVAATVTLSIVAHGVTSAWGTRRYGAWYEAAARRDPSMPEAAEHTPVGGRRAIALAGSGVRHESQGR
ncbi:MAG TPA: cation:proton antiporter [Candidatus Limnocylindrales bacterium]|jgi:NhaP-type Na+/H+ or K+/H+ antiporter